MSWFDQRVHLGTVLVVIVILVGTASVTGWFASADYSKAKFIRNKITNDEYRATIISKSDTRAQLSSLYTTYMRLWAESRSAERSLPNLKGEELRLYKTCAMTLILEEISGIVSGMEVEEVPDYILSILRFNRM